MFEGPEIPIALRGVTASAVGLFLGGAAIYGVSVSGLVVRCGWLRRSGAPRRRRARIWLRGASSSSFRCFGQRVRSLDLTMTAFGCRFYGVVVCCGSCCGMSG